ncbi:hypothetical protein JCM8097_005708 [Rhodosporidiobolus ruineniae]
MAKTHKGKKVANGDKKEKSSTTKKATTGQAAAWKSFNTKMMQELKDQIPDGRDRRARVCELWKTDPSNPKLQSSSDQEEE